MYFCHLPVMTKLNFSIIIPIFSVIFIAIIMLCWFIVLICVSFYLWKKDTGTHPSKVKMRFVLTTNSIICNLRWKTLLIFNRAILQQVDSCYMNVSSDFKHLMGRLCKSSSYLQLFCCVHFQACYILDTLVNPFNCRMLKSRQPSTRMGGGGKNWRKVKQLYPKAINVITTCNTMHMNDFQTFSHHVYGEKISKVKFIWFSHKCEKVCLW